MIFPQGTQEGVGNSHGKRTISVRAIEVLLYFIPMTLKSDFTSNLVYELAFGTPKFFIAPYGKINHRFVNLSCNCDVKLGLTLENTNK